MKLKNKSTEKDRNKENVKDKDKENVNDKNSVVFKNRWLKIHNFVQVRLLLWLIVHNQETLIQMLEKSNLLFLNKIIIITAHLNIIVQIMVNNHKVKVNKKVDGWEIKKVEVFMERNMEAKNKNIWIEHILL
jgi:hypothetical protein